MRADRPTPYDFEPPGPPGWVFLVVLGIVLGVAVVAAWMRGAW